MSSRDLSQNSQPPKVKPHKLFITGLDGQESDLKDLESELRNIFRRYGELEAVVPKRSYNGSNCFAFIDYKQGEDATIAVQKENHCSIGGKKITVELQDNSRRRKGAGEGCYDCGKSGHFARDCRSKTNKYRRGRSSESSHREKKKRRRHHDSYSSDRSRRKQKRKREKSRGKKHSKNKKHKKERRRSYSEESD